MTAPSVSDEQQMLRYARDLRRALQLARDRELQLAEAHQRLARLDRLKSDFLHFVSHELRTPLQHFAALDLIDSNLPPRELEEMLAIVRAGYHRLNRLVQAGLAYLELAAEAPPSSQETFNAAHYHQALAARCRPLPRVSLAPLPAVSILVRGCIAWVEQVEGILMNNALRFSECSPQPVEVSAGLDAREWRLRVHDHGDGFPPHLAGELTRPFTIGQILHHQEGTGLSLARGALLAERMGGRLEASSQGAGLGATFVLRLPRAGQTLA